MATKKWTTGGVLALDARNKELEAFASRIARLTKDGECRKHIVCDGRRVDCDIFDLTNDDAVASLHLLISLARNLVAPRTRKAA
jgi:hypothetical protein